MTYKLQYHIIDIKLSLNVIIVVCCWKSFIKMLNVFSTHFSKGSVVVEITFISERFTDEKLLHETLKNAFETRMSGLSTIQLKNFWLKRLNGKLLSLKKNIQNPYFMYLYATLFNILFMRWIMDNYTINLYFPVPSHKYVSFYLIVRLYVCCIFVHFFVSLFYSDS